MYTKWNPQPYTYKCFDIIPFRQEGTKTVLYRACGKTFVALARAEEHINYLIRKQESSDESA